MNGDISHSASHTSNHSSNICRGKNSCCLSGEENTFAHSSVSAARVPKQDDQWNRSSFAASIRTWHKGPSRSMAECKLKARSGVESQGRKSCVPNLKTEREKVKECWRETEKRRGLNISSLQPLLRSVPRNECGTVPCTQGGPRGNAFNLSSLLSLSLSVSFL